MSETHDAVNSLILMKTNIETQIYFFTNLLNEIDDIKNNIYYSYDCEDCIESKNMTSIINEFHAINNQEEIAEKLNRLTYLNKTIEQKIKSECIHVYEEDSIDINENTSQNITYCSKCWSSF